MIKLKDMHRSGVLPEHRGAILRQGAHERIRLTVPAREALERAGALVIQTERDEAGSQLYSVELLDRCPHGVIVAALDGTDVRGLRTAEEPPYPHEIPRFCFWEQVDFTPCPRCGAPLIWYEAGYVPGYRVCAGRRHHHWQVDGWDEEAVMAVWPNMREPDPEPRLHTVECGSGHKWQTADPQRDWACPQCGGPWV
jgi:predicted RNA-binding Zn-ribbon protein involved in translation (DUF1610 family)